MRKANAAVEAIPQRYATASSMHTPDPRETKSNDGDIHE
jgi:hypothetical protein